MEVIVGNSKVLLC